MTLSRNLSGALFIAAAMAAPAAAPSPPPPPPPPPAPPPYAGVAAAGVGGAGAGKGPSADAPPAVNDQAGGGNAGCTPVFAASWDRIFVKRKSTRLNSSHM